MERYSEDIRVLVAAGADATAVLLRPEGEAAVAADGLF